MSKFHKWRRVPPFHGEERPIKPCRDCRANEILIYQRANYVCKCRRQYVQKAARRVETSGAPALASVASDFPKKKRAEEVGGSAALPSVSADIQSGRQSLQYTNTQRMTAISGPCINCDFSNKKRRLRRQRFLIYSSRVVSQTARPIRKPECDMTSVRACACGPFLILRAQQDVAAPSP